ncbi:MAG: aminopeptidase P family protein [Oscillospiraceae bacterium]|nr:aminopeptidase P family protein [Oscillospiraceae bacterium]
MKNLQSELKRLGENRAALIISPENRRYFTSFPSSDGFLIVSADKAVFITDGRYIEAAEKSAKNCEVVLQKRIFPQIAEILSDMKCGHLLVEASRMTLDFYNSLKGSAKNIAIHTDTCLDSMINTLRSVKTEKELECIKAAQKITDDAFTHICGFIKEGVTEREIGLELDFYMLSHGGEALSFETIAVSGQNTSMPHGVPSDKKVCKGDFITMDFGTVVGGYHSDMTRTVALGFATDEMKRVYETVKKAQSACINGLRAGLTGIEGDALARNVIENEGFGEYFTHSTGHGVGIEIHEFPNLNKGNDIPLVTGQIVTVEPGIYIPNKFGVRIEDMVYITENGCEDLTHSEKELIILP